MEAFMATVRTNTTKATFWYACKHEVFKVSHQQFYRILLILPIIIAVIAVSAMTVLRFIAPPKSGIPKPTQLDWYALSYEGSFGMSSNIFLTGFVSILLHFVLVVACSLLVGNEYSWNTIKMLAIRQSSRVKLVLSKCLISTGLIGFMMTTILLLWFVFGWFFKFYYNTPFELTNADTNSINRSLGYLIVASLKTLIFALLAIALTFRFKNVVAGIIGHLVYQLIDSNLSSQIARAINAGSPDGLYGLINLFLLESNINRLTQVPVITMASEDSVVVRNSAFVSSTPVWWSFIVLGLYLFSFTALAVYFFTHRDITD
jgi:ABC-type transport system involved in multi-copper enzyme maturation permease subunit